MLPRCRCVGRGCRGGAPAADGAWLSAGCHGVAEIVVRQQAGEPVLCLRDQRADQPAHLLAGVMPSVQTPGCACARSLVKASTGMPAARATGATAAVSAAVSGPMITRRRRRSRPARRRRRPRGVPPVSRTSSVGAPGTSSASWAPLHQRCAAVARSARSSGGRMATLRRPAPATGGTARRPPGAPADRRRSGRRAERRQRVLGCRQEHECPHETH